MNRDIVAKLLSERLDTYFEAQKTFIDSVCWFAEDFTIFKEEIVNEIVSRLPNQNNFTIKNSKQPILPFFYLIDAIVKKLPQYGTLFGHKLSQVFKYTLMRNEKVLNEKLPILVEHWKSENVFNDNVIESFEEEINSFNSSKGQEKKKQNPISFGNADDDILPPQENPQMDQHNIQQMQPQPSPQMITMHINPIYLQPDFSIGEERRLCREWMKNTAEWESSKYEPSFLIRDLDRVVNTEQQSITIIKLTPENANARCISCSGTFDRCVGPSGEECLKGAIYEDGRGYMHQRCQELQERDGVTLLQMILKNT